MGGNFKFLQEKRCNEHSRKSLPSNEQPEITPNKNFQDTRGLIRSRISKNGMHYNGTIKRATQIIYNGP